MKCRHCGKERTTHYCNHARRTVDSDNDGDFITSAVVGYATNSAIIGGLVGGSFIGGIVGDMMNSSDSDSSSSYDSGSSDSGSD